MRYTQRLMSGMKGSFSNVTENVVLQDSEQTCTQRIATTAARFMLLYRLAIIF